MHLCMVRLQKCTNSTDADETPLSCLQRHFIHYLIGNEVGLNIGRIKSYIREVYDSGNPTRRSVKR